MASRLPTILGTSGSVHCPMKSCNGAQKSRVQPVDPRQYRSQSKTVDASEIVEVSKFGPVDPRRFWSRSKMVDALETSLNCRLHHHACLALDTHLEKQVNDSDSSQTTSARCSVSSVSSAGSFQSNDDSSRVDCPDGSKPRYYTHKIESWFHAIDAHRASRVNFRQFMAALRRDPSLQAMLCKATGVTFDERAQRAHSRLKLAGLLAIPAQERSALLVEERRRIKEVFHAFGTDAAEGMLDMPMFKNAFYQCGLVFEPQHFC